jgi:hypothetical protein
MSEVVKAVPEVQWFYREDEGGDHECKICVAITDLFYLEIIYMSYAGFHPSVYMSTEFEFHPYFNRPGELCCKNREEALQRFTNSNYAPLETRYIPSSYEKMVEAVRTIFAHQLK